MTRIFISYSRTDEIFARKLATALSNLSADIWIDIEDIPAGMKWSSAIQQGLDTADALIVVISPEAMTSRNVEDEWQYFLDHDKPVIPILLREAKIHFQLNRIQWIDFKNQPFDVALLDLHSELRRNGIQLDAAPRPVNEAKPLSHGHAAPPQPQTEKQSNSILIYAGGGIGLIVLAILIAVVVSTLRSNLQLQTDFNEFQSYTQVAFTQINDQASRIITLEAAQSQAAQTLTQSYLDAQEDDSTPTGTRPPTTSTPTASPPSPPIILGPVTDNSQWAILERTIDGVTMVLVPSGRFTLGTTQEHYDQNFADCEPKLGESSCHNQLDDEFNGSLITINEPYWIDKYEVSEQIYGSSNRQSPQVNVTSGQAQAHCETRNGSLPDEAEWEFAAKGASGWRYPWGNSWDLNTVRANICDSDCSQNWRESNYNDGYPESAPVNEIHSSASWVGAFNMVGNVWEWTSDSYSSDTTNTLRGGSWTWIQGEATTTSRSDGIAAQSGFYGFRCVRPYVEGDLERYSE